MVKWTPEKIKFIKDNPSMSYKEVAKILKITELQAQDKIKRMKTNNEI